MLEEEKEEVLAVHFGHSASCSSIGSVVDVLFVSGVVGTALLAALAVMLGGETKEGAFEPSSPSGSLPLSEKGSDGGSDADAS